MHDRLEQGGARLQQRLADSYRTRDLEIHRPGVHLVITPSSYGDLHIGNRIPCDYALDECLPNAGKGAAHAVLWQLGCWCAAVEQDALTALQRLDSQAHDGVMPMPSGLFTIVPCCRSPGEDGLPVGYLGQAGFDSKAKIGAHAIHTDLQVQLSHAGKGFFTGLSIIPGNQRGVFLTQTAQCLAQAFALIDRLRH